MALVLVVATGCGMVVGLVVVTDTAGATASVPALATSASDGLPATATDEGVIALQKPPNMSAVVATTIHLAGALFRRVFWRVR